MELVQEYLEKRSPISKKNFFIKEYNVNHGAFLFESHTDALEFRYKNMQIMRERDTPIFAGIGNRFMHMPRPTTTTIEMAIVLDNNDLHHALRVGGSETLTLRTDHFQAQGFIEAIEYGNLSYSSEEDEIIGTIRFYATTFDYHSN